MALINWDGTLAVGHELIDEQHKTLISIINTLHDCCVGGNDCKNIRIALMELYKYTLFHFSEEEKLMVNLDAVLAMKHKCEHEKFISQLDIFAARAKEETISINNEVFLWLMAWLVDHVSIMDKELASAITKG